MIAKHAAMKMEVLNFMLNSGIAFPTIADQRDWNNVDSEIE
jgi:hypothetical protein